MVDPLAVTQLIWKMLEAAIKGYSSQNREFFEKHIEPLQERMITVHKDYISGFEEVRQHIQKDKMPPMKLVEFLRERRRDYEHERQLSNDLAAELAKLKRFGMKGEDVAAIERYAQAILQYFSTTTELGDYSWYTDLLDWIESHVRTGQDHNAWSPRFISGNPRKVLLDKVDSILNVQLPEAFGRVSASYASLRTRLL